MQFSMMLAAGRPVPLHGSGSNSRNYIFVTDVSGGDDGSCGVWWRRQ